MWIDVCTVNVRSRVKSYIVSVARDKDQEKILESTSAGKRSLSGSYTKDRGTTTVKIDRGQIK